MQFFHNVWDTPAQAALGAQEGQAALSTAARKRGLKEIEPSAAGTAAKARRALKALSVGSDLAATASVTPLALPRAVPSPAGDANVATEAEDTPKREIPMAKQLASFKDSYEKLLQNGKTLLDSITKDRDGTWKFANNEDAKTELKELMSKCKTKVDDQFASDVFNLDGRQLKKSYTHDDFEVLFFHR